MHTYSTQRRDRKLRSAGTAASVIVLAASALTACDSGSTAGKSGKSFSVAVPSSYLQHFIPGQAGESDLSKSIFVGLSQVGDDGKAHNAVAQSITSKDQTTWTIQLKKNWTFHNGEPVTAQAFADSWNATAYAPNAMGFNYVMDIFKGYSDLNPTKGKPKSKTMSGVKVTGKYSLTVTLTSPLSDFPYVVAGTAFAPMPKAAFKNLKAYDQLPIGDGPYEVASPGAGKGAQQITLKRYAKYAGAPGGAAQITVRAYQDNSTAFTSFRSGAVDIAQPEGNDLVTASKQYKSQLVTQPAPAVMFLGFPSWDPRFRDKRVRQAFSLAIDRNAIVTHILGGFGKPAKDVAPATLPGGGGSPCQSCTYDPALAKKLLAEAGGWHGSLTLWTKQDPTSNVVLQAILNQLRTNLGIKKITLQSQPVGQIYTSLAKHDINGPFMLYTGASYPTLYSQVDQLFSPNSGFNVTGYKNAKVNSLLAQAAKSNSTTSGTKFVQQASRTALGDLPLAPLYYPVTGIVHAKGLSDLSIDYLAEPRLPQVKTN